MNSSGLVSQRVMKDFPGFRASPLSSLPWREGVRGRGTGPPPTGAPMFEKRLVMEVDGGQHGEEAIARRDEERTRWLNRKGYRVVRFRKSDIPGNLEGVLESIVEPCMGTAAHPHPNPLPSREREWKHERMAHAVPSWCFAITYKIGWLGIVANVAQQSPGAEARSY